MALGVGGAVIAKARAVLEADTRDMDKGLNRSQKNFQKWNKAVVGISLVAAAGIGAAALKAGQAYDEAMSTIRTGTGATGKALEALGSDFKNVLGQVPQDAATVSKAIADINTRTGATGEGLQALTKQFLDLGRVSGEEVPTLVASGTRVFGDWSIATKDQADALDHLFKVSQSTGVGVTALMDDVVKFGAPMRQMGFSFKDTSAILGKFEKEGVNGALVMGSMRIALGKAAQANQALGKTQDASRAALVTYNKVVAEHGRGSDEEISAKRKLKDAQDAYASSIKSADVPKFLRENIKAIKDAGSAGEANAKALKIFGAKAGPDMAAAIREGRFDIDELTSSLDKSKETIEKAGAESLTFTQRLQILKNDGMQQLMPAGMGLIDVLEDLFSWMGKHEDAMRRTAIAAGALAAGVVAVTIATKVYAAAMAVSNAVTAAASVAMMAYRGALWMAAAGSTRAVGAARALNAALATGPLLLAVAAVAALNVVLGTSRDRQKEAAAESQRASDALYEQARAAGSALDSELALQAARLGVREAAASLQNAEDGLAAARKARDPKAIAAGELTIARAKLSLASAQRDSVKASAKEREEQRLAIEASRDAAEKLNRIAELKAKVARDGTTKFSPLSPGGAKYTDDKLELDKLVKDEQRYNDQILRLRQQGRGAVEKIEGKWVVRSGKLAALEATSRISANKLANDTLVAGVSSMPARITPAMKATNRVLASIGEKPATMAEWGASVQNGMTTAQRVSAIRTKRINDQLALVGSVKANLGPFMSSLRSSLGNITNYFKNNPIKVGIDAIMNFAGIGGFGDGAGVGKASSVDSFTPLAGRNGLVVTSGYRPGDDGYHGSNRARDYGGPASGMMAFAKLMLGVYGSSLKEMIYSPLGVGIKNGKKVGIQSFYGDAVYKNHLDHVHVAMQHGGRVPGMPWSPPSGDSVPALLEPDEVVVNRTFTRAYPGGPGAFDRDTNGMVPRFAAGGRISKRTMNAAERQAAIDADPKRSLAQAVQNFNRQTLAVAKAQQALAKASKKQRADRNEALNAAKAELRARADNVVQKRQAVVDAKRAQNEQDRAKRIEDADKRRSDRENESAKKADALRGSVESSLAQRVTADEFASIAARGSTDPAAALAALDRERGTNAERINLARGAMGRATDDDTRTDLERQLNDALKTQMELDQQRSSMIAEQIETEKQAERERAEAAEQEKRERASRAVEMQSIFDARAMDAAARTTSLDDDFAALAQTVGTNAERMRIVNALLADGTNTLETRLSLENELNETIRAAAELEAQRQSTLASIVSTRYAYADAERDLLAARAEATEDVEDDKRVVAAEIDAWVRKLADLQELQSRGDLAESTRMELMGQEATATRGLTEAKKRQMQVTQELENQIQDRLRAESAAILGARSRFQSEFASNTFAPTGTPAYANGPARPADVTVNQHFTSQPEDPWVWIKKSQYAAESVFGG